ncbi:hypothetical protein M569_01591 [Genlisea aurea]|uniref:Uncharacterized protein n=1 Tax=Genlisea aurea TaxID=192259 RepID=S8EKM6_9LAMI|nr:hypothetical protein M569_01591 [Genlisea aurea]
MVEEPVEIFTRDEDFTEAVDVDVVTAVAVAVVVVMDTITQSRQEKENGKKIETNFVSNKCDENVDVTKFDVADFLVDPGEGTSGLYDDIMLTGEMNM